MEKRFLGGVNEATIVLCNPNDQGVLLTVSQIKKVLRTKDGFFRKSNGYFRNFIKSIEYAKTVTHGKPQSKSFPPYATKTCTDYFITSSDASIDVLSRMKYAQQIVSGYHLTPPDLVELEKLIEDRRKLIAKKEMAEGLVKRVSENKETLLKMGFNNPTITNPDLAALKDFAKAWIVDELQESHSKISEWYNKHKLRDYAPSKSVDDLKLTAIQESTHM